MIGVSTTPVNITLLRKHNTWYTIMDGNWSNPNIWISNGKRKNSLPQPEDDVYIDNNINIDVVIITNNLYVAGSLTAANGTTITINGDLQATGPLNFNGSNTTITLNGYNNNVSTFTAGNTTVKYNRSGDQNVLPLSYNNLVIYNSGIKYLSASTTIQGNLNVNDFMPQDAVLECSNYDLTVNGNTSITFGVGSTSYNFSKSGVGKLLFIGSVQIYSNTLFSNNITNIEFRGGVSGGGVNNFLTFNCPTSFTTNSQTINCSNTIFNNSLLIGGNVTLTTTSSSLYCNGLINGTNSNSIFNNNGFINIGYANAMMTTGIFNYMNTSNSSIGYVMNGDFALPYTVYNNLTIMGSGLKTLSGNTSVTNLNINNFYQDRARLDCLSYNLMINGNAAIGGTGVGDYLDAGLLKSEAGSITFIGQASFNTANISFPSSVTLEFRNGVNFGPYGVHTGTINAVINFTTNSQTLQGSSQVFNGSINISGGIILTTNGSGIGHIFNGILNGNSGTDTLKNSGGISYQNPTCPMSVGILDCNSSINNFYYSLSGNQDLKAGLYYNLILTSGGVKSLLGNISVKNSYSLGQSSSLNTNGYVIGNP